MPRCEMHVSIRRCVTGQRRQSVGNAPDHDRFSKRAGRREGALPLDRAILKEKGEAAPLQSGLEKRNTPKEEYSCRGSWFEKDRLTRRPH